MSNQVRRIDEIFAAAIEIESTEKRANYLDQACGDDCELRRRLEELLTAHFAAGSFLESPARGLDATSAQAISEPVGTVIGPYKLLEQIGEGGMGVVYMADQQSPVRRRVALKITKPGMDTRQVIARFEAERQALALMDHSNIARVLDAGTTESGRPYFVMELVRGVPITDYCDQNNLPVHERLELFVQVCQAVQHAHQKGIIHRDIKPSNVLVTQVDGHAVPKVIDFGVAKAINQQLTEKTLFTNFAQMIGTPLYMSPEQAEMTTADIDTRSDIYSLGVLLYELLTGTTPFDQQRLRDAAFDEIRRIIREEEPAKPSTRISTLGDQRTVTAEHRKADPNRLSQQLRGDLDWIVMKSLEKDRNRRYETANGLARDIDRYLNNQPVEASPPSASYRFRKFARRNRAGLATGLLVSVALVMGTAVSTWQAVRATKAERLAEAERREAEIQRAASESNFQKARAAVDTYFTQVSETKLLDVAGLQPLRMRLLQAALDFYRGLADEHVRDPSVLADLAVTYMRIAEVYHANNRNDDAVAAIDHALAVIDRLRREFPQARDQRRRMAGYWTGERQLEVSTDMPKDPEAAFRSMNRLIENWQLLADESPEELAFRRDLAGLYNRTGDLLESAGQPAEAVAYIAQAILVLEKLTHDNPEMPAYRADLAQSYEYLARYLPQIGRIEEAESNARKALAIRERLFVESPQVTQYLAELAFSLLQVASSVADRDPAEAEKLFRRALEITEQLLATSPAVPMHFKRWSDARNGLVDLLAKTGRQAESDAQKLRAVQFMQQLQIPSEAVEIAVADSNYNLGEALATRGKHQEAYALFQRAAAIYDKIAKQPDSPAIVRLNLGHCYRWMGGVDNNRKAVGVFGQLVAESPSSENYKRWLTLAEDGLGFALTKEKDFAAAETSYRRGIDIQQQLLAEFPGNEHYLEHLTRLNVNYGNMLVAAGRTEEAQMVYRAATETCHQLATDHPQDAAQRYHQLGDLFAKLNQSDDAIMCFRRAIELTPDTWSSHHALADQLKSHGQDDEAIEHYRKAISLNPSFAWSHTNLSGLLARKGNLAEALTEAKTAALVAHSAHDADAEYGALSALSDPLNRLGDKEKDLLVFRECVAATPRSEIARYFLATALGQQNLDQEAVVELREAIQIKPQWEFPRLKMVEELLKMGQLEEALTETQAIRIASDKGAWPRIWLGRLLARQGMYDAAVESLLAAMEKEPDNRMPFDELRNLVAGFQGAQDLHDLIAKIDKTMAGTPHATDWRIFREGSADSKSETDKRGEPMANE